MDAFVYTAGLFLAVRDVRTTRPNSAPTTNSRLSAAAAAAAAAGNDSVCRPWLRVVRGYARARVRTSANAPAPHSRRARQNDDTSENNN